MHRLFILIVAALALLAGCGQTIHHVRLQDGVVRSQTGGEVGFASADVRTEQADAIMPTCVARIGRVPGQLLDEVEQCEEEAVKESRRHQHQRDIAADPLKYYAPYSYGMFPTTNPYVGR